MATALVSGAFVGLTRWELNHVPLNMNQVRGLAPGATEEEVKRLFGPPQDEYDDIYGIRRWCYYRTNWIRTVYLLFNTNRQYTGYELDD